MGNYGHYYKRGNYNELAKKIFYAIKNKKKQKFLNKYLVNKKNILKYLSIINKII